MSDTLQQKIDFLSRASSYADAPLSVELVETHMSLVFLTDRYAYKMKKPVVHDHLDFSSLETRKFFCEEELRLNRRLAANVYLNLVSLNQDEKGRLDLNGRGHAIEWLVQMRRLPAELSLENCLRNRTLPQRPFNRLAEKLGLFYITSRTAPIQPAQYREDLSKRLIEMVGVLASKAFMMPREVVRDLYRGLHTFMTIRSDLLDERVRRGKIIEGHADLRAEHVYLEDDPVVVDCLEFSKALRTIDAAADMAFLVLECERLGAAEDGVNLMKRCFSITGDQPPPSLVHFYQTYHACSRACLALLHLNEPQYKDDPKWRAQAREWLRLAKIHASLMK